MRKKHEMSVIEPNTIAEAKGHKLSKAYLDTLHIALNLVAHNEHDTIDTLDYEFCVNDYKDKYGLQFNKNAYRKLKKSIRDTMNNNAVMTTINEKGNDVDYYAFQEVEYIEDEYKVHITFTRRFKKILCGLLEQKGKKIYYALPDTLQMKSEYTKKMYPILLEYIGKPMEFSSNGNMSGKLFDRIDSIENFKELLSIPSSYQIVHIKDTCNTIVAEIEAYTPYHAEVFYNQIAGRGRYGGKTTHICWTIQKKEKIESKVEEPETKTVKRKSSGKSRALTEKEKQDYNKLTEQAEQITIDDINAEKEQEISPITNYIMELTGLDVESAEIVSKLAEVHGRDFGYIQQAYETAKESGAENLGKLMSHFMKKGFTKKSKKVQKSNKFNNFEQRNYDWDKLEETLLNTNE